MRDARTSQAKKEALLKKAMTTKYPLVLILMEMAQELALKNCELQLQWMRGDFSQLADDPTNEDLAKFDHTPQRGRLRTEDIGPEASDTLQANWDLCHIHEKERVWLASWLLSRVVVTRLVSSLARLATW